MNLSNLRWPTAWRRARHWHPRLTPHILGDGRFGVEDAPRLERFGDGGYPLFYVLTQKVGLPSRKRQTIVCPTCATNAYVDASDHDTPDYHMVTAVEVNWENAELFCDCGERIPSAYADEDEDEECEDAT